jgi:hypothetical protein
MPNLRREILNASDAELLTDVCLITNKISNCETPMIRASSYDSIDNSFSLFNTAEQFNLNARLEFICGKYHGLNFHWLRLF